MKILYHGKRDNLTLSYHNGNNGERPEWLHDGKFSDGFVLYEVLPQKRFLFINRTRSLINLPYLYFGLRYYETYEGSKKGRVYMFPSVYQAGLQLYFSTSPIKSFNDRVYTMPTDSEGYVCVDHNLDYSCYKSLENLSSRIIGSWYGVWHESGGEMKVNVKGKLKEFLHSDLCIYNRKKGGCTICDNEGEVNVDWEATGHECMRSDLRSLLTTDKRYSREKSRKQIEIPEDAQFIGG